MFGGHSIKLTPLDLWWPLIFMDVVVNLHLRFFWPSVLAKAHTTFDLWWPLTSMMNCVFISFLVTITYTLQQFTSNDPWPHGGHHHHRLSSGILMTKFGSHSTKFTIFHLYWALTLIEVIINKLASEILLTKVGSHSTLFTTFLPSLKVIFLLKGFFWLSLIAKHIRPRV